MPSFTVDYDGTATLVREKIIPRMKDQFFKSDALMFRMRPKAEMYSGGSFIRQPLSFAPEGGGGQWWSGTDRFDTRIRSPFTSATYFAKNFELPIVISQDDEDAVNGPEAWISLVQAKMTVAQRTIMNSIGGPNGIYNDGSNAKAITGLQYSLPDYTGTAPGVYPTGKPYAGIPQDSGANNWWNSRGDNTAYRTGEAVLGGNYIQAKNMGPWDNMFASQGLAAGRSCTLILINYGVWNEISQLVNAKTTWFRPQQNTEMAKHGFRSFMYQNKTVVVDENVPRNATTRVEKVYFIDEESLHLWIHTKRNFAFEGWRQFTDQAVRVAYIWFRGELGFDERRSSGVHSNVDTTLTSP